MMNQQIMAMTWGDGFAALIGQKYPIKMLRPRKSLGGSLAFFFFSAAASIGYLCIQQIPIPLSQIFIIAIALTAIGVIVELYSPKNLDNLTIPFFIGFIGYVLERSL